MQAILLCQRPDRSYDVVSGPKEILCHFKRELLTEKPKDKLLCTKFRLTIVETSKVRVEVFNLQTTYLSPQATGRACQATPRTSFVGCWSWSRPPGSPRPRSWPTPGSRHAISPPPIQSTTISISSRFVGWLVGQKTHTHAPELKNLLLCKINSFINLFVHILIKCQSCFIQSNAKLATIL